MSSLRSRWSYSYTVLLICWLGWIALYLSRSVLAPILPLVSKELSMTHTQAGALETAYLAGYIIVKMPAGTLANRMGIRKVLITGIVGYGLSTALSFFATSFTLLFLLRFLVGLFQGTHLPLANTLLSERFRHQQDRAIGFHESGPNVGNSIAYPLTVAIASTWGWRYAFLFLSFPAFVLAVAAALFLKEEGGSQRTTKRVDYEAEPTRLRSFARFLAPLALAHAVYNLCLRTLLTFGPSYLMEFRGMAIATAGLVSMLMPATGFIAKVSSGFVSERIGRKQAICGAAALSGVSVLALAHVSGDFPLALNFIFLGLVLYLFSPVIYASVTATLPTSLKSVGLALVTMTGEVFGAISTFLFGFFIDVWGYQLALTFVSATVISTTALVFMLLRDW